MKSRLKKITALALSAVLAIPMMTALPDIPVKAENAANTADTILTEPETIQVSNLGKERSALFNSDWKFFLGKSSGAHEVEFNDSDWRNVDLPHDYSLEQDFTLKGEAESGFLLGGTGWYRKSFTLPEDCKDKTVTIDFDGVYMNATVYVNGREAGNHPYGYTSFAFDISDEVVCDGITQNVIAVKVDNQTPSSRWYSGSGIYRDVHIEFTDKVHIARHGTTVTTPNLEEQKNGAVDVNLTTVVDNDTDNASNIIIKNTVFDASGNAVSDSVSVEAYVQANASQQEEQTVSVANPELWSVDSPNLYYVGTEILKDDQVVDSYETEFGFRYFSFDNDTGFTLYGEKMKLKGVCLHHDQGSLGAKAYEDAIERQIKLLKEMGCNSIRVTHNPAADVLVKLSSQYGMLLIDEAFDTWLYPKNGNVNDYGGHFTEKIDADNQIIGAATDSTWAEYDIKEMISRGKNAPSIIMWSLGNEIMEGTSSSDFSQYASIAQQLIDWGKEVDTTRPYTVGDNNLKKGWKESFEIADILTKEGGTVGMNYCKDGVYNSLHNDHPDWAGYGSETASALGTRGTYTTKDQDTPNREITAYDKKAVGWGATASSAWFDVIRNDFVAGTYVWTGFDYIGEPTPWNGTGSGGGTNGQPYPKSSYFGIIDTAGFPKDDYYLYQSQWNENVHTLHILPCWDEEDIILTNGKAEVVVYTDASRVEMYLNGMKVGEADSQLKTTAAGYQYRMWQGKTNNSGLYPTFNIDYEAGTLTAKAFDENGNEITDSVGRSTVQTSGNPGKLTLSNSSSSGDYTTIDADGASLSYICVDVEDKNAVMDPDASNEITFRVEGDGELVGTDNGDPRDITCFVPTSPQQTVRRAYNGKALAIVKSTRHAGSFTLTASADGLESDSVTVATKEVPGMELTGIVSYSMPKHCYVSLGAEAIAFPETLSAAYADGTVNQSMAISWDGYDKSMLSEVGKFKVTGTVQDSGQSIGVSITVHVSGNIIGAMNYSGITSQGVMPTLPVTVQTLLDTGNTYEEFPVAWNLDNITAESFNTVNETVVIKGIVNALGKAYPVNAAIRVGEPVYGDKFNIAPQCLTLTESCTNPSDTLNSIINGIKYSSYASGSGTAQRWSNWNERNKEDTPVITFTWATAHLVDQINLFYYTDTSGSNQLPTSVEFEYSVDGTSWNAIGYNPDVEAIPDELEPAEDNKKIANGHIYQLNESINPIAVRIKLGHDTGKFVGLSEAEVISTDLSYESNNTADLTAIEVDGSPIADFDPSVTEYTVSGKEVTNAASAGNAAFTIVPKYNRTVRILTKSEDQAETRLYTIHLQRTPDEYSKLVTVSAPGNEFKKGDHVALVTSVIDQDGNDATSESTISYKVTGPASCSADGILTLTGAGKVTVIAIAAFNGKETESTPLSINVTEDEKPLAAYLNKVMIQASKTNAKKSEKVQLTVVALDQNQKDITSVSKVSYAVSGPASCSTSGILTFTGAGIVTVSASAAYNGKTVRSSAVTITVTEEKTQLSKPSIKYVKSTYTASGPKVKIMVNNNVKGAAYYTVYRKYGSKTKKLGKVNKSGIIYDVNPLTSGKKARYYVIAASGSSQYTNSSKSTVKSIILPKAPAKLTAKKTRKGIQLTWKKVSKAKGYIIYRSNKKNSGYKKIASLKTKTTFLDKKAKSKKTYFYAISTIGSGKKYSGLKGSNKIKR